MISVGIPKNKQLPKEIATFTPEENYAMFIFGMESVLQKKNPGYISHLASLEKTIEDLSLFRTENAKKVHLSSINCALCEGILNEERWKNENLTNYQKLIEHTTEKLNQLYSQGNFNLESKEKTHNFRSLASQTFRDFADFQLQEKNEGEYQLNFKEFSILVDTNKENLTNNLLKSDTCFFGWSIATATATEPTSDSYKKANFMFEWLSGNKCICHIYSLATHEDPIELLRSIYYTCQTIHKITNVDAKEITELHTLKENESRVREISQKIIQNSLERDEMLNLIKTNFQKNDEMIRQILNKETNALIDKRFARIIDWWNFHIVNEEGPSLRSSNIWTMFKRDNPDLVGEIQANDFKDVIYTFIAPERIIKPRNKFGALEIKNLRWKVDRGNTEN